MPQITGAISKAVFIVELSLDGTAWVDVSGAATTVEIGGGDLMSGEAYTADGPHAIVTVGKAQPQEVTVAIVYTEGLTDPFKVALTYKASAGPCYIRYKPAGTATGRFLFKSDIPGRILNVLPPSGDAGTGDVSMTEFTWRGPALTQSAQI